MNVLRLHDYWKLLFTEYLAKEDLIIDLLPEVHRKSYDSKNIFKIKRKDHRKKCSLRWKKFKYV